MSVSTNLKKLRNEKGITQNELSKALNINRATYAHYETGRREPDIQTLKLLAKYFNVSVDYLLGNINDKNSESNIPTDITKNTNQSRPKLNEKDELDIKKDLNKTLEQLEKSQDGLMFDGEPMDEETRELLRISLENSMRIAKQAAKKYTPKKYKK